jgi:hypothetical protein
VADQAVADLVLISIGYLFLISTWIDCWKKHVDAGSPPPHPGWVQRLQRILQLVFIAAVATAIASGATSSNAIDSTSARNQVVALRHASAILALGEYSSSMYAMGVTGTERMVYCMCMY